MASGRQAVLRGGNARALANRVPHMARAMFTAEMPAEQVNGGLELYNAKLTYGDMPTMNILRSLAVLRATQYRQIVDYGPKAYELLQKVPGLRDVTNAVVKKTFFRQFCGGETLEECRTFTDRLQSKGVACIFDYSVEAKPGHENSSEEDKFDRTAQVVRDTIDWASSNGVPGFSCIKLSGVARPKLLEMVTSRLLDGDLGKNLYSMSKDLGSNPFPGLSLSDNEEFFEAFARLDKLCAEAADKGVPMLIDAEDFAVQGSIDLCALALQKRYNSSRPMVYTTVQSYLKNAPMRVRLLKALGEENKFVYAVKQVRGAYMKSERRRAAQLGYDSPICDTAEDTHEQFNSLASVFLKDTRDGNGAVMFATHNAMSLGHIAQECGRLDLDRGASNLHVAQLYGMGDSLTLGMVNAGYNAAKYVPFGPVDEVMPYLTRRLQENNDALSGAPRDISMFMQVLRERDLLPKL